MKTAVVTGLGVMAPNGMDTETYWSNILDGKSGINRIQRFDAPRYPVKLAAELATFDPAEHVPSRLLVETSAMSHLAFVAAEMALRDAEADPAGMPEYELGVITANATGGVEVGQRELEKLWTQGPDNVSAYMSIAWFYAATTGQLSIRHKFRGHCGVVVSEQAGGLDAIGHGRRVLRQQHRLVLVGGTESAMSPAGVVAQIPTNNLSHSDDPSAAFLPFDVRANGYVPGEGGAILVIEDADTARERGAPRVYGEIAGYAATFDPRPGSDRPPTLAQAIRLALADAQVAPDDVDVVFADAYGVPELDRIEAAAISAVFGPQGVPVTAPKTMTGRIYAGAGALDTVAALLSIRDGVIPPTVNVDALAPGCDIDLVRERPRTAPVRTALVLGRGHGGFNSAVVVRAVS
ncbi:ketosynthase chain-length factor [Micromonospora sp. WMMD882]|uniref:ketosynthase chain-length factor n=1 Tax=Micromonospora sp. WMMD882 TaxID=3015151 RepID=UPI00248CB678|nr:ketosynthase chain-length factor [Micromonospora sp. WMMD882]WBB81512.1 ketosynthase chain-length factor [Micromonospora sp. WMMD882]